MGIQIRNNSIRIDFYYKGMRCRETLKGLKNTKANKKYAEGLLATINHEIGQGTFIYNNHFPESKKVKLLGIENTKIQDKLLGEALKDWLYIKKSKTAPCTIKNYTSKAKNHIIPAFENKMISTITKSDIDLWIAVDLKHLKNKTINEILIVMRGVFADAKADRLIKESPLEFIDNLPVLKEEPDPFTKAEIHLILSTKTHRTQEINMVKFNFWAGLRISELMALGWDDIDLTKGTAHIQIAKVEDIYKTTKTFGSNRVVELLLPAIEAINQQIELTFESAPIEISVLQSDNKTVKKQMFRPIFVNTCTSLPHCNYHSLRDRFWVNHLKNAKVRYRSIGNTRHTYASQLLSTGAIPKEWITKQLGHTSTKMIDKHYGKWISEDAPPMTDMANKALGF